MFLHAERRSNGSSDAQMRQSAGDRGPVHLLPGSLTALKMAAVVFPGIAAAIFGACGLGGHGAPCLPWAVPH